MQKEVSIDTWKKMRISPETVSTFGCTECKCYFPNFNSLFVHCRSVHKTSENCHILDKKQMELFSSEAQRIIDISFIPNQNSQQVLVPDANNLETEILETCREFQGAGRVVVEDKSNAGNNKIMLVDSLAAEESDRESQNSENCSESM